MNEGWIKLHRKMMNWEWYNDSKTLHLFIHLLINANHSDKKWQGKMIKRGQLITGRDKIKSLTGISTQSIRTSLQRLRDTKELTIKATNKYSLITILNYDLYQFTENSNQQTNQQLTIKQPTTNQQLTTNKKEKNDNKDKEVRELYDLFISQSNGMKFKDQYFHYIDYLFKTNELGKPLKAVLSKDQQIEPKYFDKLMEEKKEGISILQTTFELNNYTARKYKTFYSTLLNWVRR